MARRRKRSPAPPAETPRRPWIARTIGVALALAALSIAGVAISRSWRRPRPNLLVVTIDTLRADHVGAYGYAAADTPVMDSLAREGARFENALSAVPITGPAHATIFTGQYPPVHGVRDNVAFPLGAGHRTLASILQTRGYRTAAFVAAFPVAAAFGFGRGFDHFNEDFHATPGGGEDAERPGNEVADRAIEWLTQAERRPFFAWVHFYDPHAPYTPPAPYRERFHDRPYDGEVAFADAQLGRVLAALRTAGLSEDTVVAVLGDHGEALGDHGEATHAILVYQPTLHVPLFLSGPGVPSGMVVAPRVSLVDVLPTLLGLLGVESPAGVPGRDLRPALAGKRVPAEPLYAESLFGRLNCRWAALRVWVSGDWKLVDGAAPELFDLAVDPREERDLAARDPQRVETMRAALRAAVAKMVPHGDAAHAVALSPEQEERLRSLGYASGGGGAGPLDQPGLPDPRTHVRFYEIAHRAVGARGAAAAPALAELTEVVRADPGNPFAQFALGEVAYRDGRLGTAGRAYARAVELDPDRPAMRVEYGALLRDAGALDESERQLRIAVEQTTADDAHARASLAETLAARGGADEAARIVDAILVRTPDDPDALAAKARLLVAQGRPAEAQAALERAGAGAEAESWVALGELYLRLGQPVRAQESAARALQIVPGHPWALAVAGEALIRQGRREEGLAALARAVSLRPRRPQGWLSLAGAFDAAGQRPEAERCRREAEEARRN
jgi:arylsulfatase A-like enzyme/tetratricopeptide (TPR) repeat protein